MVEIKAADIIRLRQQTGAGMMDCKKALTETAGDFEAAVDYLRKKGAKVSALRAGREAKEGLVIAITSESGTRGVILSVNCETDFVAKNEEFASFAKEAAKIALDSNVNSAEQLLNLPIGGITIGERVAELVGKIGEKIEVKKVAVSEGAFVVPYIHSNNKLGVLVAFNRPKTEAIEVAGKDVAMQVAAMNPVAIDQHGVSQEVIDRELDIAREKAKTDGKPEQMIDKIAAGALNKFFKEQTLLSQEFVKDPKKTIADLLKSVEKELTVVDFKRVSTAD
jgi:elongation factor Ts